MSPEGISGITDVPEAGAAPELAHSADLPLLDDPALAHLVARWSTLDEETRQAIIDLADESP